MQKVRHLNPHHRGKRYYVSVTLSVLSKFTITVTFEVCNSYIQLQLNLQVELFVYLCYYTELPAISTNGASKSIHQAGSVSLSDVKVLTQADWIRIQNHLHKNQAEEERLRKLNEERIRLHEMSQEKIKNWTNTVYVSLLPWKLQVLGVHIACYCTIIMIIK